MPPKRTVVAVDRGACATATTLGTGVGLCATSRRSGHHRHGAWARQAALNTAAAEHPGID